MDWGDEEISGLMETLMSMAEALNVHNMYLQQVVLSIEALDARTQVAISTFQGLSARLDKLEAQCPSGE